MSETKNEKLLDVKGRIQEYLWQYNWNPELADHEAVRHLMFDIRDVIGELEATLLETKLRNEQLVAMVVEARLKAGVDVLTGEEYPWRNRR